MKNLFNEATGKCVRGLEIDHSYLVDALAERFEAEAKRNLEYICAYCSLEDPTMVVKGVCDFCLEKKFEESAEDIWVEE